MKEGTQEFALVREGWDKAVDEMTLEKLPEFLRSLMEDHQHDYGTVCHAMATGAVAALWAMNRTSQGGITGFQAGAVMWEFIRRWSYPNNETGLRLIDYDKMLYPQYEYSFQKTISPELWQKLQSAATASLIKARRELEEFERKLQAYHADMEDFRKRHPDYDQNPVRYTWEHLATQDEHDAQEAKKEAGFEFAPEKPYPPIHPNVYAHWEKIAEGVVPFGYSIADD